MSEGLWVVSLADDLENLAKIGDQPDEPKRQRDGAPSGWEAGVKWDGDSGEVSTGAMAGPPADWAKILEVWNLDPNEVEVIEPINMRAWDAQTKDGLTRMFYYKANVRRKTHANSNIDELINEVKTWKPRKKFEASGNGRAFVVNYADLQIGKSDGDGSTGTVQRVLEKTEGAIARLRDLRKLGHEIDTIYILTLGDCIEGFNSQGGKLIWRNDLTLTEQIRVYRRLLLAIVKEFAPLADKVIVASVPGNHDEAVRNGDKMATRYDDSFALDVSSAVADALAISKDFNHVSFVFPKKDELTLTLDISGTIVGLAHGHQTRGRTHLWWAKQSHGLQPIGEATLLLTGHYHHLKIEQEGAKTWIQMPALDGGSTWFKHISGADAPAGLVTMLVGNGSWSDLAIL